MNGDTDPRLVTRIALRNYKSIAACDVHPAPLSFLVGPNGCGKSNFLDALRFVAEALRFSLDHALRDRGGIQEVRRRSGGHPNHFGIRLELQLPRAVGWYAFRVAAKPGGRYSVQQEQCFVGGEGGHGSYKVADGKVEASRANIIEEYPDDKYSPSCLLLGFTSEGRPLHIQMSLAETELVKIITLYEPHASEWIDYTYRR